MVNFFWAITISFFIGVVIMPLIIKFAKREHANQPLIDYVDLHKQKAGTPTMGGLQFLIVIPFVSFLLFSQNSLLAVLTLVVMIGYGILGFLDDFIKVKFQKNDGLKPYQKLIGQTLVAIIVAVFGYTNGLIAGEIFVPFFNITLNLSWGYIPFAVFVFLATTNSVNLTDGLDGLASGVSTAFLIGLSIIMFFVLSVVGQSSEMLNLLIVIGASIGCLLSYTLFNSNKASIFMGDTGSLALGGLLSCLMLFSKQVLILPLLGIMFVVSSLSSLIQILYYKKTKKRFFIIAPYHHHLEKKGLNENKIVSIYIIITLIIGAICSLLTILLFK